MKKRISSYKELTVWQKSMDLVVAVYKLTSHFPRQEVYGLTSQLRRAAVSVASNIAEGKYRRTRKDYLNFLSYAYSSGAEIETQIEIAKRLSFGKDLNFHTVDTLLNEVMRMLNTITFRLHKPPNYL